MEDYHFFKITVWIMLSLSDIATLMVPKHYVFHINNIKQYYVYLQEYRLF